MMTTRSLTILGVCAFAGVVTAAVRRANGDVRGRATREWARCDRLLKGLDARCASLR